jgi:internalin A
MGNLELSDIKSNIEKDAILELVSQTNVLPYYKVNYQGNVELLSYEYKDRHDYDGDNKKKKRILSDITPLKRLEHLKYLKITNEYHYRNEGKSINNILPLSNLKEIEYLDLSNNLIENIEPLQNLSKLKDLNLSNNKIQNLSPIENAKKLTKINFGNNKVKEISQISQLESLEVIRLDNNEIESIKNLVKLSEVTSLNMFGNNIKKLDGIENLIFLEEIYLGNNPLTDISILTSFRFLKKLYLGAVDTFSEKLLSKRFYENKENESIALKNIEIIRKLNLLRVLDLSLSGIRNIDFLKNAIKLTHLFLDNNNINDISPLVNLKKLQLLSLEKNKIEKLPPWISEFDKMDINYGDNRGFTNLINLEGNPITYPPKEVVKQGKLAIRSYFSQITKQGETVLYEGKILIVGEAGAGKSTLLLKLQNPNLLLPDTSSTLGIEVKEGIKYKNPKGGGENIIANFWDFGGQEIQYNLHQYFMSSDALYVLVADNRKQNTQWDYWFHIIDLLAKKSPVIVVVNNNETSSKQSDFELSKYQKRFNNLQITHCRVDFSINDEDWNILQQTIKRKLASLPLVNKPIPKSWLELRKILLNKRITNNYITLDELYRIKPSYITNDDCDTALKYFNCIGVVLNFSNDENLKDIVFLSPTWITLGLYAAISSENMEIDNGQFSKEWIFEFWNKHQNNYSTVEQAYLLRLMLKDNFDICYPIGDDRYVIPFLLSVKLPDNLNWNTRDNIGIRVQYPFMPKGILSRIIVQMYAMIENNLVWKDGVILKDSLLKSKAKIVSDYDSKSGIKYIDIRINGGSLDSKKEFLSIIRGTIRQIHKSSFKNIAYSELIICNCEKCEESNNSYLFSLDGNDGIRGYIKAGKKNIECRNLKDLVSIQNLVGNVYTEGELNQLYNSSNTYEKEDEQPPQKTKRIILPIILLLIIVTAFVALAIILHSFDIGIEWFIASVAATLLVYPAIWASIVSPEEISQEGLIKIFDNLMRRINIFKIGKK